MPALLSVNQSVNHSLNKLDRVRLCTQTVVGRFRQCHLSIEDRCVSFIHAIISWNGTTWVVKDLGSTNGTMVDGGLIPPLQTVELRTKSELVFGGEHHRWRLDANEPPRAFAVGRSQIIDVVADRLYLPSVEQAEVVVSPAHQGGWSAERIATGAEWPVQDDGVIEVGGQSWSLHLPALDRRMISQTIDTDQHIPTIADLSLHIKARRGESHIAISAKVGKRVIDLGAYTCYYLLLYLARARLADAAQPGANPEEDGWRLREEVLTDLKISRLDLISQTHRSKTYFADRGILDTRSLIEQRRDSGELRIGVARITIDEG